MHNDAKGPLRLDGLVQDLGARLRLRHQRDGGPAEVWHERDALFAGPLSCERLHALGDDALLRVHVRRCTGGLGRRYQERRLLYQCND